MPEQGFPQPQEEAAPAPSGFEFDPSGVDMVVQAAAGKLAQVTRDGGSTPMKPDGITLDVGSASGNAHLREEADAMVSVLELVARRTDGNTWQRVVQERAGHILPSDSAAK